MELSVLLPVHNCAKYLDAALRSLCAQTFRDFEVIAVDDGSTDGSWEILQHWEARDKRIRAVHLSRSGGIVRALNSAYTSSRAPYIARMDGDDIALADRFSRQIEFLKGHPQVAALSCAVRFIDAAGWPIYTYRTPTEDAAIRTFLLNGNGGALIHPGLMARRSALESIVQERGALYLQSCDTFEDVELYYQLMKRGKLANLSEVLLLYRQHFESTNFSARQAACSELKQMLVSQTRALYGLDPISPGNNRLDIYERCHQWAQWALAENFWPTAFKYALRALYLAPFRRKSWQFLHYVVESFLSLPL